jgi:hypothetical protein
MTLVERAGRWRDLLPPRSGWLRLPASFTSYVLLLAALATIVGKALAVETLAGVDHPAGSRCAAAASSSATSKSSTSPRPTRPGTSTSPPTPTRTIPSSSRPCPRSSPSSSSSTDCRHPDAKKAKISLPPGPARDARGPQDRRRHRRRRHRARTRPPVTAPSGALSRVREPATLAAVCSQYGYPPRPPPCASLHLWPRVLGDLRRDLAGAAPRVVRAAAGVLAGELYADGRARPGPPAAPAAEARWDPQHQDGADELDRERRHGPQAGVVEGARGGRGAAGLHRAAHGLREPDRPHDRGPLRDQHAAGRGHLALRNEDLGRVAGGRGRRAPRRPGRLRGRPAPQAGPRAAREQGRQRLQRPRLPDPPARAQGADRLVLAGARQLGRALPPDAARPPRAR